MKRFEELLKAESASTTSNIMHCAQGQGDHEIITVLLHGYKKVVNE